MAAATAGTPSVSVKIQTLKNESKGQLGRNWKIEFHDVVISGAAGTSLDFNITTEIKRPVYVGGCQISGLAAPTAAVTFGSTMVVSTAGVIPITLNGVNTNSPSTYRIKIEGY